MENKNNTSPLFNRKDLLRFNSHELIFDILLVLWSELLLYSVVTRGRNLYQLLTMDQLAWSTAVITFVLSWYLFMIYYHLDKKIENVWPSTLMFLLAIAIPFFMSVFGYRGIEGIIGRKPPGSVGFWTFFGTLFSIIAGSGFAYTEQGAEEGKSILLPRVETLFLITPIGTFYMSFYLGGRVSFFAVIAIGGAILLILFLIRRQIKDRKEMRLSRFYHYFRRYVFPVIFFLVLCLWEEIYLWGKIHGALNAGNVISFSGMAGYLFFSGIIPARILMMIDPPVSLVGFSAGLFSLAWFLFSVYRLISGIF